MAEVKSSQPYPQPILSIQTGVTTPAKWQYSPSFQNCSAPVLMGRMPGMPMSGRRSTDRANLRQALGHPPIWFCHCHHTYSYSGANNPTADMEFVQAIEHIKTYPHLGAVAQWNHDPTNPRPRYYAEQQNETGIHAPYKYWSNEIAAFEQEHGVIFPIFLRQLYCHDMTVASFWKDDQGNVYELQDVLYLMDQSDKPNIPSAHTVMKLWPTLPVAKTPGENPFFWGQDACGNLFLVCRGSDTTYFYDHEEDTYTPIHPV